MKTKFYFLLIVIVGATIIASCKKKYAEFNFSKASVTISNGNTESFDAIYQSDETDNEVNYTIESSGTKELEISSISLIGADAGMFTLDNKGFTKGTVDKGNTISLTLSLKTLTI
jgi:phosphopantetheine adenylyltransferase